MNFKRCQDRQIVFYYLIIDQTGSKVDCKAPWLMKPNENQKIGKIKSQTVCNVFNYVLLLK